VATLSAGRLRAMIDSYYTMRGLDLQGHPDPAAVDDLGLA
jgi:aldehyde:ferredoxin oxidoreductase